MSKIILLVFWTMFFFCANAQEMLTPKAKSTVLVDRFTCADGLDPILVDALRGNVLSVFNGRAVVIDALKESSARNLELKRRANGDLILNDESNLEQLKSISTVGAEYVVSGKVLSLSTARKEKIVKVDVKDAQGKPVKDPKSTYLNLKKDSVIISYDCTIDYTLELTKISDGTLVAGSSYADTKNAATEADAIQKATYYLGVGSSGSIVAKSFPFRGTILEIASEKKDRALEVYINIGSEHGIRAGISLDVRTIRNIAGRNAYTQIGSITVEAVEGKDISRCSVPRKYGKNILSAVRKAETLIVSSL